MSQVRVPGDIESLQTYCLELCDSLVHDEGINPEDVYFSCVLLSTYYESQTKQGDYRNAEVCDVAWEIASAVTETVAESETYDWANAYFALNSIQHQVAARGIATRAKNETRVASHPTGFEESANDDLEKSLAELSDLIETYVLEFEECDDGEMSKSAFLEILLDSLKRRYIRNIENEQVEKEITTDMREVLRESEVCSEASNWQVYYGLDIVTDWLEQKVKNQIFI